MRRLFAALLLAIPALSSAPGQAAGFPFVYTNGRYQVRILIRKPFTTPWGSSQNYGILSRAGHQYPIETDDTAFGTSGPSYIRTFDRPFKQATWRNLVGLASLANACEPNCAASRRYDLTVLWGTPIPGYRGPRVLRLVQVRP